MNWENRFLTMRGVVITAVSLPMDKLVLAKAILWLDMERTWESFPWLAMKSLGEYRTTKMNNLSLRFSSRCLKFTMKKFKIYW